MAVYPRPDRNPFLERDEHYGSFFRREQVEAIQRENERKARELREREERWWREGVIDLVEINGVWQIPVH